MKENIFMALKFMARIAVTGRRGRSHRQLQDDLKEREDVGN
jgi:hypothetical protein